MARWWTSSRRRPPPCLAIHLARRCRAAANLFDLGLDSLMAVELRNRLQARLDGRPLSATLLFDFSTIDALCAHLGGETMAVRPAASAADAGAPIAIVGVGCRFPAGGEDPEQFWQALARGQDGIIERPERPDASVLDGAAARAGYLRDVAGFDPTFFGIAPREAVFMDPQHRLLLEVTWEALENALLPPDTLSGTPTGVFVGMCNYDYAQFAANAEGADGYAGIGGAPSIAAGRIAYLLGLTGPAMVLDTACSSSLVAVHLAVRALRAGECTVALAGGVNLIAGHRHDDRARRPANAVAGRPLQGVRRLGRRLRARRRLRRGGAEAAGRCRGGGRSRPGGDPRHRGQPGRPQRRPDRAQRPARRRQ